MEVYSAPDYLIIHLKRFSHQRNQLFGSRKLNNFINFPVNGLDMSQYIVKKQGDCLYDLYAVSNHFGSLNGGHYTAFAKNPYYNRWFNFDDSEVDRATEENVVSKAAYVLFYKRRGAAHWLESVSKCYPLSSGAILSLLWQDCLSYFKEYIVTDCNVDS